MMCEQVSILAMGQKDTDLCFIQQDRNEKNFSLLTHRMIKDSVQKFELLGQRNMLSRLRKLV